MVFTGGMLPQQPEQFGFDFEDPVVEEEVVEPAAPQPPQPGFFDPIRQEGVLSGGLNMLSGMLPSTVLGQQLSQRASDGFSVSDVFGSLGDFGTQMAYSAPGLGEALALRAAVNPDAGWVERALGTVGIAAGVGTVGYAATQMQPRAFTMNTVFGLTPIGKKVGPYETNIPLIVTTTDQSTFAQLSGTLNEPVIAGSIIPTIGGRSRQAMGSLARAQMGTPQFSELGAFTDLRQSLIGSRDDLGQWTPNNSTAVQVDNFLQGLADDLLDQVPDYRMSQNVGGQPGQPPPMTLGEVRVAAVALELSKFDHLVTKKKGWANQPELRLGKGMPAIDKHFKKMMSGKELTEIEQAELRAGLTQLAKLTMGNGHPELALSDLRVGVKAIHLGKNSQSDMVYLQAMDVDGRSLANIDEAEMQRRITTQAMVNPVQAIPFYVNSITDFFQRRVSGRMKELESAVMRPAATHPALAADELTQVVPVADLKKFSLEVTDDVRELSDDIRANGIREALVLEYNPRTGAASLIDGNKRLAAADMRGLEAVPLKIVRNDDLQGAAIKGLKVFKGDVPEILRPQDIGAGNNKAIRKAPAAFQGIIPESQRQMDTSVAWYKFAADDLLGAANEIGMSHKKLVGVASLMSAGELWEQNIEKAVAAGRYLTDHPTAQPQQLADYMNNVVGIKSTTAEAKNVIGLVSMSDDQVTSFFTNKMSARDTLKQPNFVEAILQSDVDDLDRHNALVFGLMTGEIDNYNARYLFGELDQEVPVVIDRHAYAIALGFSIAPDSRMGSNLYRSVRRAYEIASEQIGEVTFPNGDVRKLTPSELQAMTWVEWREWKGTTKNYKTYDPETFKQIQSPSNWIHGHGPAQVFNQKLIDAVTTPLPPAFTHRSLAQVSTPTWRRPKDLLGRNKSGSQRMSSGLGARSREIGLAQGLNGLQVQAPRGAHMTGGYGSFGFSPEGQDIRPRQPMVVGSSKLFYEKTLRDQTFDEVKGAGFTGSRIKPGNRAMPGLEGEMAISISAPVTTNHGIRAQQAHKHMSGLMNDAGITHRLVEEPQFQGRSTVWQDEDGGKYWSLEDIEEAGLNRNDLDIVTDTESRSGAHFIFDDPEMMRRARNFMHSANPHLEAGHAPAAATAKQGYLDAWGSVFGLGPVRGVKKELAFRGTKTELEGKPSSLDRTQTDSKQGRRVANIYDEMDPVMNDVDIASYDQMAREVDAQYEYMTEVMFMKVEVVNSNPYASPAELAADIRDNNTIKVLSSESTGGHPYMSNEQNDRFRAVHDFFGHTVMGNTFTRHGEEAAYLIHSQMFSESARGAMHSETAAQNAVLNYSKKNRAKASRSIRQGLSYTGNFAEQKAKVLPQELWSDKTLSAHPGLLKGSDQGRMVDHVYNEQILDFVMYGNGEAIPRGMAPVYEHYYKDDINLVQHMSREGDPNAANAVQAWVEEDGLYEYFKNASTSRYSGTSKPEYQKMNGKWYWDGAGEVLNPASIDQWEDVARSAKHPFDVLVDGERVSEIAVHLPKEGTGLVQLALGETSIPTVDPNRTVVWRLTSRGSEDSFRSGSFRSEVDVPDVQGNGRMDPTLMDEMVQFLNRTGFRGGSKQGGRTHGFPEFKVVK